MPLDIAFGILVVILFDYMGWLELNFMHISIAILFAILPDADGIISAFVNLWTKKRVSHAFDHKHREILHHPIIYIPAGFSLILFAGYEMEYAILFTMLSLLHFLHDSIGIGWGLRWFSPFSTKAYKFFSEKDGSPSWKLSSWTPEEQDRAAAAHGDPNWLRNIYLKPNMISVTEGGGFIVSLIVLFFYTL